jgi:hypothetical protein
MLIPLYTTHQNLSGKPFSYPTDSKTNFRFRFLDPKNLDLSFISAKINEILRDKTLLQIDFSSEVSEKSRLFFDEKETPTSQVAFVMIKKSSIPEAFKRIFFYDSI